MKKIYLILLSLNAILNSSAQKIKTDQFEQKASSETKLLTLLTGSIIARTLYALAELHIADYITTQPSHVNDIARSAGVHPQALYRALRLAASYDVFKEEPLYHFSLTPIGRLLQTNHEQSMRLIALHEDEARWNALANLTYSIKTGQQAFNYTHGTNYFDYLNTHKESSERFDASMASISQKENYEIARDFNFGHYQTIIDVGGGYGGLLYEIKNLYPHISGCLYDLPFVVSKDNDLLNKVAQSCFIEHGNFFKSIPTGYDVYILKRILHDWDDEQAITILKNCHQAMSGNSRLLIIDAIVPQDNERHFIKDIDILLLALFGGKERTKTEFQDLFEKAGLKVISIHQTAQYLSIIELAKK